MLRKGRPYGGVVLMSHKRMQGWISPLVTGSSRLAAVMMHFQTSKVLLVTVYMPVDYGDQKSLDDFMEQLGYPPGRCIGVSAV